MLDNNLIQSTSSWPFVEIRKLLKDRKELIRLKMLIEFDPNEVAEILKEKKDYKYDDALKKIKNLEVGFPTFFLVV